jgi:hypothetical protein
MIRCEECLTLPICINKVQFDSVNQFIIIDSIENCDYIRNSITAPHYLFHDIKRFFLIKKGLRKD